MIENIYLGLAWVKKEPYKNQIKVFAPSPADPLVAI
jgi:hypothetical protein